MIEADEEVVTGYVEKPTLNYEVSMGIYVYAPRALEHIPKGRFDFPDLVLALLADGEKVVDLPLRRALVRHRDDRRARARRRRVPGGPAAL